MAEPSINESATLVGAPTGSAMRMRASMAADLADAGRIIDQVGATVALAGFREPSDANVFRGKLRVHREALTRLQCELHDLTYVARR